MGILSRMETKSVPPAGETTSHKSRGDATNRVADAPAGRLAITTTWPAGLPPRDKLPPPAPCSTCGCPICWLDGYGRWHCGECVPWPSRGFVRAKLWAEPVESGTEIAGATTYCWQSLQDGRWTDLLPLPETHSGPISQPDGHPVAAAGSRADAEATDLAEALAGLTDEERETHAELLRLYLEDGVPESVAGWRALVDVRFIYGAWRSRRGEPLSPEWRYRRRR